MVRKSFRNILKGGTTLSNQGVLSHFIVTGFTSSRLLTRSVRHPGGVDGGERIYVMRWFVEKVCLFTNT